MGNKLYRTPNGNAVFVTRDGHVTLTNHSNLKENQVKFVSQEELDSPIKRCVYTLKYNGVVMQAVQPLYVVID